MKVQLVAISSGFIATLADSGFTIEKILDNGPSANATILGIDIR
jgi:hypothetical protein